MFKIAKYLLSAGFVLVATAASAGDLVPDAAEGIMNSCRGDYHRICAYVAPGDGRVARCLMDHQTELAPRCVEAIRIASSVEACYGDYERFCRSVPKGQEAFRCLASKMDLLLPACRRVVAANAPYMLSHGGERYSYNGGPAPYGGSYGGPGVYSNPAPYGGAPYAGSRTYSGSAPYANPGNQGYEDRYAGPAGRESQPYGGNAYREPGYGERYADGEPQGRSNEGYGYQPTPSYGDRYAEGSPERYRSYDDRDAGGGYPGGVYDNGEPREPYGPDGDR